MAYNGLQLLAYFVTVFIAAPAAMITGLGMSPALSTRFRRISKVLSIQTASSLHFLVLIWFLLFIVIHVTMVFTTGLLRNVNHMYGSRDDHSWVGLVIFAVSANTRTPAKRPSRFCAAVSGSPLAAMPGKGRPAI